MSCAVEQLELFAGSASGVTTKASQSPIEVVSNWLLARRPRAIETIQEWFISAGHPNAAAEGWSVPGIEVEETRSGDQDDEAWSLVAQRYAARGYGMPPRAKSSPGEFTLVARRSGQLIGTLTVNPGEQGRLGADAVFGAELSSIRVAGRVLCELTRLAVVGDIGSAPTLAALFGRAYAICRERFQVSDFVIEVNPRHVGFYRRALGFVVAAGERECPRVAAPAVLMQLDLDAIRRRFEVGARARGSVKRAVEPSRAAASELDGCFAELALAA